MAGVLIEAKSAQRIFDATRRVEASPLSEVPIERRRRRIQGGSGTGEDVTKHVYLGTIASVGGGGSYTVSVVKDVETISVQATLLGWNDDYADLVVGQSVYVVFTKGETLTAQIEV